MSISAVIICQDEEKNIKQCIESVSGICDTVIVVDGFSRDDTKSIAMQFSNVQFIERDFDNYINQKNFANENANSNYILSLDADEYCSEELTAFIKNKGYEAYDAIELLRINYIADKPICNGIWGNDRKVRIWKKGLGRWAGTRPHEHLELSKDARILKSDIRFFHKAYSDESELYSKSIMYAQMAAERYSTKSVWRLFFSMILNPPIKFVKGYFLKNGYRDGEAGWQIAKIGFLETLYKYKFAIRNKWKLKK